MKSLTYIPNTPKARAIGFSLLVALSLLLFQGPLRALLTLSLEDERYSYVPLIPLVGLFLIYLRASLFLPAASSNRREQAASLLFVLGVLVVCLAHPSLLAAGEGSHIASAIFALVLLWMGGFGLFYGIRAVRVVIFPLCFLFLMIPIPSAVMGGAILGLQKASAEVTAVLFNLAEVTRLSDVHVLRQGFTFSLPGAEIEVAEQCSGIRSSLALLITAIVAGQVFLRSSWGKIILVLLTIPITVIKNAFRIVTISWLGVYVDEGFLHGRLHQYGGLPFSALALVMLGAVLLILRRTEGAPLGSSDQPR